MIWDIVKKEVISSLQFTYHGASTPVFVPSGLSVLPPISVIFTSCCWTAHLISVANNQYVFFLPLGWSEVRFILVRLQIGIGLDRLLTRRKGREVRNAHSYRCFSPKTSALVLKIKSSVLSPRLPPQILCLPSESQDPAPPIKYPDIPVSVFLGNLEGSDFNSL